MPTNTKRKTATATRKGAPKPQSARAKQTKQPTRAPRTDTKQALVLKMLHRKSGATIPPLWLKRDGRSTPSAGSSRPS